VQGGDTAGQILKTYIGKSRIRHHRRERFLIREARNRIRKILIRLRDPLIHPPICGNKRVQYAPAKARKPGTTGLENSKIAASRLASTLDGVRSNPARCWKDSQAKGES